MSKSEFLMKALSSCKGTTLGTNYLLSCNTNT